MTHPMTVQHVLVLLEAKRQAIRAELDELRREGVPVLVDANALFLCELLGLVVDLEQGTIIGTTAERYSVQPAQPVNLPPDTDDPRPRALLYARTPGANAQELERQLVCGRQLASEMGYRVVYELSEYAGEIATAPPQLCYAQQLARAGAIEMLVAPAPATAFGRRAWQTVATQLARSGVRLELLDLSQAPRTITVSIPYIEQGV